MKFRVERDGLADAVTWAARSLSTRPTMPVLAGLLLKVSGDLLSISGFDLEASTEVDLTVTAANDGQALVSGRLLADITKALPPHPVDVAVDGSRLTISCGSSRFTRSTTATAVSRERSGIWSWRAPIGVRSASIACRRKSSASVTCITTCWSVRSAVRSTSPNGSRGF